MIDRWRKDYDEVLRLRRQVRILQATIDLQKKLNEHTANLVKEVLDHTKPPDNMDRVDDLGSWLATVGWFKRAKRLLGYEDAKQQ